jgi:hypothetical protein
MKLSVIATRLAQVTKELELVAHDNDADMPDEFVPRYVMNIFCDSKMIFALLGPNRSISPK